MNFFDPLQMLTTVHQYHRKIQWNGTNFTTCSKSVAFCDTGG